MSDLARLLENPYPTAAPLRSSADPDLTRADEPRANWSACAALPSSTFGSPEPIYGRGLTIFTICMS